MEGGQTAAERDRAAATAAMETVVWDGEHLEQPAALAFLLRAALPAATGDELRALSRVVGAGGDGPTSSSVALARVRAEVSASNESAVQDPGRRRVLLRALDEHAVRVRRARAAYAPERARPLAQLHPNPDHPGAGYRHYFDTYPFARALGRIDRATPIISAGSCFAGEIALHLQRRGYNYLVTRPWITGKEGLSQGSAPWGTVFNCGAFSQLVEWAFGERDRPRMLFPVECEGGVRYRDPLRGGIWFDSPAHYEREVEPTRAAAREAFTRGEVFILTLGLTEAWRLLGDGSFLASEPWQRAPELAEPVVLDVEQNLEHLERMRALIKRHNPGMRFVVTVSPISLNATFRGERMHVVEATTESKAVLRVAAARWAERHEDVEYFPSYETVMVCSRRPWVNDQRHASRETVAKVMRIFELMMVRHVGQQTVSGWGRSGRQIAPRIAFLARGARGRDLTAQLEQLMAIRERRPPDQALGLDLLVPVRGAGPHAACARLEEAVRAPRHAGRAAALDLRVRAFDPDAGPPDWLGECTAIAWRSGDGVPAFFRALRVAGLPVIGGGVSEVTRFLGGLQELEEGKRALVDLVREQPQASREAASEVARQLSHCWVHLVAFCENHALAGGVVRRFGEVFGEDGRLRLVRAIGRAWPAVPAAGETFPERLPGGLFARLRQELGALEYQAADGRMRRAPPAPLERVRGWESAARYATDGEDLLRCESVQEILASPGLRERASSLLGMEPILDLVEVVALTPGRPAPLDKGGEERLAAATAHLFLDDAEGRSAGTVLWKEPREDSPVILPAGEECVRVLTVRFVPTLLGGVLRERPWLACRPGVALRAQARNHPRVFETFTGLEDIAGRRMPPPWE